MRLGALVEATELGEAGSRAVPLEGPHLNPALDPTESRVVVGRQARCRAARRLSEQDQPPGDRCRAMWLTTCVCLVL